MASDEETARHLRHLRGVRFSSLSSEPSESFSTGELAHYFEAMAAELARLRAESMRGAVEVPVAGNPGWIALVNPCCVSTERAALEWVLSLVDEHMYSDNVASRIKHHLNEQQAASQGQPGPEREARHRLGVWLASVQHRTWQEHPPDESCTGRFAGVWTIKVTESGTDVGIADKPTWAKAVNEALAKAEQFERESNANRND